MTSPTGPGQANLVNAGHYENFPVASILLPARLRPAVRAIYHFARTADDLADEGDATPEARLAALDDYRRRLDEMEAGATFADDPERGAIFGPLAETVRRHDLPYDLLHDLLDAFSQDVSKTRYAHFGEVMDYARRSANPIGRLLLKLYGDNEPRHLAWSDGICSALQIINFLQDIAIDWQKGRVYLPQDELARFGITEAQIAAGRADGLWGPFMQSQIDRARRLLKAGSPLGLALKGRIGLEMRLIILGGERILWHLERQRGDVFRHRPQLGWRDAWPMLRHAVFPRRPSTASTCGTGGCGSGGCGSGCSR